MIGRGMAYIRQRDDDDDDETYVGRASAGRFCCPQPPRLLPLAVVVMGCYYRQGLALPVAAVVVVVGRPFPLVSVLCVACVRGESERACVQAS